MSSNQDIQAKIAELEAEMARTRTYKRKKWICLFVLLRVSYFLLFTCLFIYFW